MRFRPLIIDSAVLVIAKLLSLQVCIAFSFVSETVFEAFARGSLLASLYSGLILASMPYALQLAAQDKLPTANTLAFAAFIIASGGCLLTTVVLGEQAAVLAQMLVACTPSLVLPLLYERISRRTAVVCHGLTTALSQPMSLYAQATFGDAALPSPLFLAAIAAILLFAGLLLFFNHLHTLKLIILANTLTMLIGQVVGVLIFANAIFSDSTVDSGVFWLVNQGGMLLVSFVSIMRFRLLKSLSHFDTSGNRYNRFATVFYLGFSVYCAGLLALGAVTPAFWAALYGCFLIGQAASKLAGLTLLAARDKYALLMSGGIGSVSMLCCWWVNGFSSAIGSSVSTLIWGAMCSGVFLGLMFWVRVLNPASTQLLGGDAV